MVKTTTGHKIAVNLSWLGLQELFARLSGILLVLLLARALSPADYGSLNICLSVMLMVGMAVRAGTGSRATRLTAASPDHIPSLYTETTGLRIFMAIAALVGIVLLAPRLSEALSVPSSLLILSTLLLFHPALTVAWAFRGLDQMKPIAMVMGAERLIVLLGVLLLLQLQAVSVQTVMLLEILAGLAIVLYLRRQLVRVIGALPRVGFRFSQWGEMLRESLPVSLAAITASLYRHGDLLLLGVISGSSAAAMYLIPQKLVLTLLIPASLIGHASFPSASRHVGPRRVAATKTQANLFRYSLLMLLPLCTVVWLFASDLLILLFGDEYEESGAVLKALLLTAPLYTFGIFQESLLLAVPRPRAVMMCRVLASCGHMLLSLLLIPKFGVIGAAVGCIAGQTLFSGLATAVWMADGGKPPLQWRCLVPVAASALILLLISFGKPMLPVWQLLGLSLFVYVTSVILLGGVSRPEIFQGVAYLKTLRNGGER